MISQSRFFSETRWLFRDPVRIVETEPIFSLKKNANGLKAFEGLDRISCYEIFQMRLLYCGFRENGRGGKAHKESAGLATDA
jgi:hypothetical protein